METNSASQMCSGCSEVEHTFQLEFMKGERNQHREIELNVMMVLG